LFEQICVIEGEIVCNKALSSVSKPVEGEHFNCCENKCYLLKQAVGLHTMTYIYYCCSMVKIFGEGYYGVSDRKCGKKRSVMLGMFRGLIMATSPWITGWDEWMRLLRP